MMAQQIAKSEVPAYLRSLRNRTGLSMQALARKLGYADASGYQRYESESAKRPRYLSNDLVNRLADQLVGLGDPAIKKEEVWALAGPIAAQTSLIISDPVRMGPTNVTLFTQRDLPIWGQSRAGEDGYFFDNGAEAHTSTYRPIELMNVRDAYAVYVNGNSMSPRFKHGELVYVDPTRPPGPGDDVVIQLNDGQGYIKELVRRTARSVLCRQHNPAAEVEYPSSQVKAVHLIVTMTRVRV